MPWPGFVDLSPHTRLNVTHDETEAVRERCGVARPREGRHRRAHHLERSQKAAHVPADFAECR